MVKRKRPNERAERLESEEGDVAAPQEKKSKLSEQKTVTKLLELLGDEESLTAGEEQPLLICTPYTSFSYHSGLTYLLKVITESCGEDGDSGVKADVLSGYLGQHPDCKHILTPLQWDREKRTYNVVSIWPSYRHLLPRLYIYTVRVLVFVMILTKYNFSL